MHSSDSAQCVSTRPPICRGCNMRKGAPGFSRGEVQAVHTAHRTLNTELVQFVRGLQNERGSAAGFNHSSPSMPLERLLLLNQCLPCFNHRTLCNAECNFTLHAARYTLHAAFCTLLTEQFANCISYFQQYQCFMFIHNCQER